MNVRVFLMSVLRRGNLMKKYKYNLEKQYQGGVESIKEEMMRNAMAIFRYHVENNPAYRQFLDDCMFDYSDLNNVVWENIPFTNKETLRKYYPEIKSEIYNYTSTGGSTNTPFRYPSSKDSALAIWPSHWTMHQMCGINPYDSMLMLMAYGNKRKTVIKRFYHTLSNFVTFNSFTMNEQQMFDIYHVIKSKRINFIYGYASSINQFLRFLKERKLVISLKGIFTTSENKINSNSILAKEFCNCEVFDQYGAHDGDVFAFECEEHNGLHVLHDLSTVEIIQGEIILTAVKNKAFPFIRYQVGDKASDNELITEKCKCGRTLFRLPGISGRNTYFIKDNDGQEISVMLFTHPFDDDYNIMQYQVVEEDGNLRVNIITDVYTKDQLVKLFMPFIRSKIERPIEFVLNQEIYKLKNAKVPLYYHIDKDV